MTKSPIHEGHERIITAFKYSLAVIALFVILALAGWYLLQEQDEPLPVFEQSKEITPVIAQEQTTPASVPVMPFTDITVQAGLDFVHTSGAYGERLLPEAFGGGGGFLDYDNDGDMDILLTNSNQWPTHSQPPAPTQRLYRNNGDKTFTDVSQETGLALTLYGMGAAFGDIDNDGWVDIYITALGKNRLLRNEQGRFVDISDSAGVAGLEEDWSTSSAFIDIDNDGDLDLFVVNYVRWSRKMDLEIDFQLTGIGRAYGSPTHFSGTNSRLYRNEGSGRFVDISEQAGILVNSALSGLPEGKGLGILPVDYDLDGWIDLVIANDTVRNFLFHNQGDGTFEEIGELEGIAYDRDGKATGAMGIDANWYRNDAELGIAIGNFSNEMSSLFATVEGRAPFADEAIIEGFGPASRLALTFAVLFMDVDLDGRLDLFQANGHLEPDINTIQASQQYAQPAQFFWHCGEACRSRLVEVKDTGDLVQPLVGRGAAYADIDNDGDLDLLIMQNGRAAKLFENTQQRGHHWLRVNLQGTVSNRDGIGAIIELTSGGQKQLRQLMPTRGYLSQVEKTITFGLGPHDHVDGLHISWPGGSKQSVTVKQVNTTLNIIQE